MSAPRAAAAAICLTVLAAGAGCSLARLKTGAPISAEQAAALKPGAAKREVIDRLGPPDDVRVEPPGSIFEYYHGVDRSGGLQLSAFRASFSYDEVTSRFDRLLVTFDRDGVVRDVAVARGAAPPR